MKNKSVLMRVLADIGRSRALIAVSLLLSAASVVFNLYIPVLAGDAIDGMIGGKVDMAVITPALIKIFICAAAGGVLQWIMSIINNKIAYDTVKNIRSRAFSHIQRLPVAYIDSHAGTMYDPAVVAAMHGCIDAINARITEKSR